MSSLNLNFRIDVDFNDSQDTSDSQDWSFSGEWGYPRSERESDAPPASRGPINFATRLRIYYDLFEGGVDNPHGRVPWSPPRRALKFLGKKQKTSTGLQKEKTYTGLKTSNKVKVRRQAWRTALWKARSRTLGNKGFKEVKKGTPLYYKALEFYRSALTMDDYLDDGSGSGSA